MSDIKGRGVNLRPNSLKRDHGPRARSSGSDTQIILIVLAVIGAVVGVALLMSGGSSKSAQPRNAQGEQIKPRPESAPASADPMDFSDLKQELYGDKNLGSGSVGENDAKNAREAIRDLAYGSNFSQVMSGMIGPGRYGTYDEAVRHLRPYLERATKQGALRPEVLTEIDAQNAANAKQERDYHGR